MEVRMKICPGHIDVLEVIQNKEEIVNEVVERLGTRDLRIRDGKVVRWVKNPYYDDFAEHTHDSPGRYELVSESEEDIELLKAAEMVIKALRTNKKIGTNP